MHASSSRQAMNARRATLIRLPLAAAICLAMAAPAVAQDTGQSAPPDTTPPDAARRSLDPDRLGRAVLAFLGAAALVVALGRALEIGYP